MNPYPDGVTGLEYAIAGPDTVTEIDGECPDGHPIVRVTYHRTSWDACTSCDWCTDAGPLD
jgi:hypothetical protein